MAEIYGHIKRVISTGKYVKDDMLKKLDVYLLNDRITNEQYNELVKLVDPANEDDE